MISHLVHLDIEDFIVIVIIKFDSTSRVESMEYDEGQHGAHGEDPEYGAIFMSNSATKRECFSRRLFGLPSSQSRFVMQVKYGMILFLFEYEKRQLHGVFRACSDGAMYIEPDAFRKSGKQFPAQVKFTPIWSCIPLKEDEFRDIIKENYFSAHKFNFGLSEEQVCRLLYKFSLRKETDHQPRRQLLKFKVARGRSMDKVSRADVGGIAMSDKVKDENDWDDRYRPAVLSEYPGESFGYSGRESAEGKFAKSLEVENKHKVCNELGPVIRYEYIEDSTTRVGRDESRFAACDRLRTDHNSAIDHGPVMSNAHSGYFLSEEGHVSDHSRFAIANRLESECNLNNGTVPPVSNECHSLFQPNLRRSFGSNKPIMETDSVVQDQLWPHSTSCGSIEPQISYPSYRDGIVTRTVPYDPDVPSINFRRPSPSGIDHSTNPVQEYTSPYRTCAGNLLHSPKNQPYFPSVEPKVITNRCPDDSSGFGNHIPFPTPYHYERFCNRTSISSSGTAAYSENLATELSGNQDHVGLSFSQTPIAPVPLSETGNNGMENQGLPSFSSTSSIHPSFAYNFGFPVESQGKHEHEVLQEENNEAFTARANVPLSNKGQVQLHSYSSGPNVLPSSIYNFNFSVESQGKFEQEVVQHEERNEAFTRNDPLSNKRQVQYDFSGEPRRVHVHEDNSPNHDFKFDQDPKSMYSDYDKNRKTSVFSRLSLAPAVVYEEHDGDSSVDEVMAMLQQSHHQWGKTKKSKTLMKRRDDAQNVRNKIQTTSCPKPERDCFDMNIKKMKMNSPSVVGENVYQTAESSLFVDSEHLSAEWSPFVDFKRRSEVRKTDDDTKNRGCYKIAGSDRSLGVQRKRRKLIRPDFSKKESSNEQGTNDDVSRCIDVFSQESSVSKGEQSSCEALVGSQDNATKLSQSVVICSSSGECKNIIVERGLDSEGELRTESCETSFRVVCEDRNESSLDNGVQNACEDKSHNAEDGLGVKDPMEGQLSLVCDDTSHSILPKSFVEIEEENTYKGTAHGDIEHGSTLPQSVENVNELSHISGEIAMGNTVNNSGVDSVTLQRIKEFIDSCVDEGKRNNQKQSITKRASSENARCSNVEESSQEICEGNVGSGEILATPNGGKSCEMEFHQNMENKNEVIPRSCEISKWQLKTISSDQNSRLSQEPADDEKKGQNRVIVEASDWKQLF